MNTSLIILSIILGLIIIVLAIFLWINSKKLKIKNKEIAFLKNENNKPIIIELEEKFQNLISEKEKEIKSIKFDLEQKIQSEIEEKNKEIEQLKSDFKQTVKVKDAEKERKIEREKLEENLKQEINKRAKLAEEKLILEKNKIQKQEIDELIKIAVSDGIFTDTEKEIIFSKIKLYNLNKKEYEEKINKELKEKSQLLKEKDEIKIQERRKKEVDILVKLATVDGVLTENEKKIIYNKVSDYKLDKEKVTAYLKAELAKTAERAETRLIDINKEKGNIFEACIANKFSKDYFTILDWRSDKYSNGTYAESITYPDFRLCFKSGNFEKEFAVECKYRSDFYNNGVKWANEKQIENYKSYAAKYNIPVFIVIGVGGSPNYPDNVFIIPLKYIKYPFINNKFLMDCRKNNFKEANFLFKCEKESLK